MPRTTNALTPAALFLAASTLVAPASAEIDAVRLASGLDQPLFAAQPPGENDVLYIAEKTGAVRELDLETGALSTAIAFTVSTNSERGLLGMAFHPDYQTNGEVYFNATNTAGDTEVFRITVDPALGLADPAAPASRELLLTIAQPQANHNAGWLGFSPNDGLLYIATGDGGGSNDTGTGHTPGTGNSQDITDNLLGKVLRIDPSGDDFPADPARNYAVPPSNPFVGVAGDDEIWSYGLRNPFRCSFDSANGDLWIGDVGQNAREEINVQPGASGGGENYGWRLREGTIATPSGGVGGPRPADNVDPVYEYLRGFGAFEGLSVTGGTIYRGPGQTLQGRYVFGDFVSNNIWAIDPAAPAATIENLNSQLTPNAGSITSVAAFITDNAGNLYICDLGGEVFRVYDRTCPGDANRDGVVATSDLLVLLANWGDTYAIGPENGDVGNDPDARVGTQDLLDLLAAWGNCP